MYLYYDTIAQMYSLKHDNGHVEFIGPLTHCMLKLQEYGLTESQAREAALQAIFNRGDAVSLSDIKKMASFTIQRTEAVEQVSV